MRLTPVLDRLRPRRLMFAGALAVAAVALVPSASYAYYQYTTGRTDTHRYVKQGQWVDITPRPHAADLVGPLVHRRQRPRRLRHRQQPEPAARRQGVQPARADRLEVHIRRQRQRRLRGADERLLTLFINDDVPRNGSGYFGIESVSIR